MAVHQATREISKAREEGALGARGEAGYRALMALTDLAIARLEELNLAEKGGSTPDEETARRIKTTLAALPAHARRRFGYRETVQEALDGFFDVQEELMLPRQREQWLSPYDAA